MLKAPIGAPRSMALAFEFANHATSCSKCRAVVEEDAHGEAARARLCDVGLAKVIAGDVAVADEVGS